MVLVNCSECGKEISDKAKTCQNCGCPIVKEIEKPKPSEKIESHLSYIRVVLSILLIVSAVFVVYQSFS